MRTQLQQTLDKIEAEVSVLDLTDRHGEWRIIRSYHLPREERTNGEAQNQPAVARKPIRSGHT